MKVSELVQRAVVREFPGDAAREMVDLLGAKPLPFLEEPSRERDRVQLAILLYARGDVRRARTAVDLAATDWRDLLVAVGLANEDWPEVLRAAGYAAP